MNIIALGGGIVDSNSYIIYQDNIGILIDAGVETHVILHELNKNNIELKYIILTHGHADHIYYAKELKEKTNAKIIACEYERELLNNPNANCSFFVGGIAKVLTPDMFVKDNEELDFFDDKLKFIHTPGHTVGSMCIKYKNILFSGDTLFKNSIGRTDFETGDFISLEDSIRNKLYSLEDDTIVYTGHGEPTTIGDEKKYNYFVNG